MLPPPQITQATAVRPCSARVEPPPNRPDSLASSHGVWLPKRALQQRKEEEEGLHHHHYHHHRSIGREEPLQATPHAARFLHLRPPPIHMPRSDPLIPGRQRRCLDPQGWAHTGNCWAYVAASPGSTQPHRIARSVWRRETSKERRKRPPPIRAAVRQSKPGQNRARVDLSLALCESQSLNFSQAAIDIDLVCLRVIRVRVRFDSSTMQ